MLQKRGSLLLIGAAMPLLFAMGCGSKADDAANPNSSAAAAKLPVEERIKALQNNPNVPPQAKETALAKLRAEQGQPGTSK